jgi:DNA repair protein RecN (Recombination protein N)
MLRFLRVRHLAVIDEIEVEFGPGFNVLTGETGAGKSILVEAIDLLVGGRSSADLIRTGEEVASVEAIFDTPTGRDIIVRREISTQGRSRAYIDDALATTAALRELGSELLELHGQHQHQSLLDPAEHLGLLDAYAGLGVQVAGLEQRYRKWRDAVSAVERSRLSEREKAARLELVTFHLGELDRISPVAGEDERLAAERAVLGNADRLERLSGEVYAVLYDGDDAVLARLGQIWKKLAELASLDPRFDRFLEDRTEVTARLEEAAFFLRSYAASLDASPARLQEVEDRLAALERLKRKFGPALSDVIERHRDLKAELDALESTDERVAVLAQSAQDGAEAFRSAARAVSEERRKAAGRLGAALEKGLGELAMPQSRVEVRVESVEADASRWTAKGMDIVELFLSANPGEEIRPLARIASGGELSRIMLALRTLESGDGARTVIFDEVDAGIGGAAADAVGARLQRLGEGSQVLCITHLPQIAARGDAHYSISKRVRSGRTITQVEKLDGHGRELELGRMIAGAEVSPAVVASAREMLDGRRRGETRAKGESESAGPAKAKGRNRGA